MQNQLTDKELLARAIYALDIAQSLLEKSNHHPKILAAYTELRAYVDAAPPPAQVPLTPCRLQELWNDAMHKNRSSTNDAAMDFARAIEAERGIKPAQVVQP
jgi:hypothetical protein